ncbi:DUF6157 family protein [Arthrobacter pigmenti]
MEHTTNYFDTFIEVAEDCPVARSEVPPAHSNAGGRIAIFPMESAEYSALAADANLTPAQRHAVQQKVMKPFKRPWEMSFCNTDRRDRFTAAHGASRPAPLSVK